MKYDPEYREMFPSACPVSDKYPAACSGDYFGDTKRNYWLLYEGTPAGTFAPQEQFWGTSSDGHRIGIELFFLRFIGVYYS